MGTTALRENREARASKNETGKGTKRATKSGAGALRWAATVLLLAGMNAGLWFYCTGKPLPGFAPAAARSSPSPTAGAELENVALDPFLVNLAGGQGYLKLGMTLGIRKEPGFWGKSSSEGAGEEFARSPLVRDAILDVLARQNTDALLTSEGKTGLKNTLKAALKAKAPEMALDRIYFTDFLVQR